MNSKRKVLFVTSQVNQSLAGGHVFLQRLIDSLESEFSFSLIGRDKFWLQIFRERKLQVSEGSFGFEPVTIKNLILTPFSVFLGLSGLVRFFKQFQQADVIVFNASFTETFFLLPWLRLFFRKQIIHMMHGNKVPKIFAKTFVGKILIWLWGSDAVTFVSNSQLQEWQDFGLKPKNARVIYNGVSVSELKPELNQPNNSTDFTFGFLGRLEEEKGLPILFEALQDERLKEVSFRLKIAGDGSLRTVVENVISKDNRLEYLGSIGNTKDFLESLEVLIVPSQRESFGLVVCEAWERGVPVICSNIPVFKELKSFTDSQEQELIFSTNEARDLADKILIFCRNSNIYKNSEHRQKLHNLVKHNFSTKNMTTKYADIFR